MNTRTLLAIATLSLTACQEVEQPTTVLTQEQWNEVKQYILDEAPEPKFKIGANFDNKIELVGFDVEEPVEAGKKATFTWYWKALDDVGESWKIFVHFDSAVKPFRQNLDHVPVRDMYETSRWKKGQVIKDVQEVMIQADFPVGKATPYIGFYRGDKRLPLANEVPKTDEPQPRVIGPTLMVRGKAGATSNAPTEKPRYGIRTMSEAEIDTLQIDGKIDEQLWTKIPPIRMAPFGTAERQTTWMKAFITEKSLVVAAHMDDKHIWGTLKNRDDETWREEVLEMFLDPDGDGKDYMELQITPLNTVFDARFPTRLGTGEGTRTEQIAAAKAWNLEGLETAVHVEGTTNDDSDQDQSWSVEMRMPLAQIPGLEAKSPQPGDKWALNFYRFDRPQNGTTWAYAWSTAPRGDFHQVDKFGSGEITASVDLKRPVVTPEMLKQMRKNIDLKVRPALKGTKVPKPSVPPAVAPKVKPPTGTAE